jgi:TRAP-type C4-dicarboxylate transport system substrate-binding protein
MNRTTRAVIASGLAVTLLGAAGCGSTRGDKAGGGGDAEATVLTFALPTGRPPLQLESWAESLADESNGNLTVDFQPGWRDGETDFEQGIVADIQTGKVEMGWVGARVFDRVGVNAFQALLAPLLVDSHDLQAAVFDAGIPEQMLGGVEDIGLVGIGVLPGPMRKVLGVDKPFLRPADFAGAVVGMNDSALSENALRALGATPRAMVANATLDGMDGYEQQLASIVGNHYAAAAGYVTTNINLWPRPLVIVIGEQAYQSLTADQQAILHDASRAAIPDALADSRTEDANAVPSLCRDGMTLPVATDADLAELRRALEPVYEQLSRDETTNAYLDQIEALKDELGGGPDTAACPANGASSGGKQTVSPLDGTYQWTLTDEDALKWGTDNDQSIEHLESWYPSTFTAELDEGRWSLSQTADHGVDGGSYEEFRDRIVFTWDAGGPPLTFTYTVDGDGNITLTPVEPMENGDAFVWSTKTWTKVPA